MILTDHASLTHLQTRAHLSPRQARWLDFLGEFKFEVMHIAGKKNVADYFSRVPGYDALTDSPQLCSMTYTFGVPHGLDLPVVHELRL